MSITSYAQNFEDVMLWRALGHVPKGFYIDIGAQHPVTDSVSKAFYEKGWRGIHVEATPAYAALLRQDRPDELVIEAAVNDVHGVIRFFEIPATGISTGDSDVAHSHQARGFDAHEIVVPCITLEDIFQQVGNQDIHWLKVDVESMEEQVLRSWGQSPARPWVVVVESTVPLMQIDNHLPWEGSLLERGYTHAYFDGLNRYYLAADQQHLASAFVSGPNVFDGFTLNGDASAPFCAAINERHRLAQQALQDQLNAKDEQALQLQGELQAKEQETRKLHEQHANQAAQQQALASKWQAERQALQWQNKEAEHAHAIKQLALQELAGQSYQESQSQVQNHLQNLVQREQAFAAHLQALQSELNVAQQAALQRTVTSEIEAREREYALSSKAADDLRQANHQVQARLDALSQIHQRREDALQAEKTQSLQRLAQAREEFQKQIQALEIEAREREHALRSKAADDLLQANHQAQARLNALSQSHQHREDVLQAEKTQLLQRLEESHAESQKQLLTLVSREQAFAEKFQELGAQHQEQARSWAAEQKSLFHQIERLQLDVESHKAAAASQAQQHAHLLEAQAAAHKQAMADCAAIEEQVKAELLNERYTSEQLSQTLAETRSVLAAAHAHWTWRVTAPLRALSRSFLKKSFADQPEKAGRPDQNFQPVPLLACPVEPHLTTSISTLNTMTEPLSGTVSAPIKSINSLSDLLGCHGDDFIHKAYQILLGRPADSEGFTYYLSRLRSGYGKPQILGQILASKEGRARANVLPGVKELIASDQKSRHWLTKWFNSTAINQRQLNRLEYLVCDLQQQVHKDHHAIETRFAHLHHTVAELSARHSSADNNITPAAVAQVNPPLHPDDTHLGQQAKRWMALLLKAKKTA